MVKPCDVAIPIVDRIAMSKGIATPVCALVRNDTHQFTIIQI